MDACLEEGIPVVLDTSGYGDGDTLAALAKKSVGILYDMKMIDDRKHRELTGVSNHRILANLERLCADADTRTKIKMRMPLLSGINDTQPVIEETCRFYAKHHLQAATLLPYHALGIQKSRNIGRAVQEFEPPPPERLHEIQQMFAQYGIQTEILGEPGPQEAEEAGTISERWN
jgi:pyruvate formate lyase activating enzyme